MTVLQGEVDPALDGCELVLLDPVLCVCYKYCCSLDTPLAEGTLETIVFSANQTNGPWQATVGVSHVILSINYTNSCYFKAVVWNLSSLWLIRVHLPPPLIPKCPLLICCWELSWSKPVRNKNVLGHKFLALIWKFKLVTAFLLVALWGFIRN